MLTPTVLAQATATSLERHQVHLHRYLYDIEHVEVGVLPVEYLAAIDVSVAHHRLLEHRGPTLAAWPATVLMSRSVDTAHAKAGTPLA